jgi:hypothetical protein
VLTWWGTAPYICYIHTAHTTTRHTFGTLRQVEEFLQLPCFNYKDFILRQPLSAGATAEIASTLMQGATEEEAEEDDGVYELSAVGAGGQQDGKGKGPTHVPLKPPKRVPLTFAEQVRHHILCLSCSREKKRDLPSTDTS